MSESAVLQCAGVHLIKTVVVNGRNQLCVILDGAGGDYVGGSRGGVLAVGELTSKQEMECLLRNTGFVGFVGDDGLKRVQWSVGRWSADDVPMASRAWDVAWARRCVRTARGREGRSVGVCVQT